MNIYLSEFIGTAILILLGNGVVANVVFKDTKGSNSGWIVITVGWALAVFIGVTVAQASGAHLNPAVTIAMIMKGSTSLTVGLYYIAAQMAGAIVGATFVYLTYRDHYSSNDDANGKLATFCNSPVISNVINNLLTEAVGTFVLIFGILYLPSATTLGGLNPLPVSLIVLSVGISLGGPTGYAINPARDLGPRIAHFLLPIPGKRDSNWAYAWIPVVGPIIGALIAVAAHSALS